MSIWLWARMLPELGVTLNSRGLSDALSPGFQAFLSSSVTCSVLVTLSLPIPSPGIRRSKLIDTNEVLLSEQVSVWGKPFEVNAESRSKETEKIIRKIGSGTGIFGKQVIMAIVNTKFIYQRIHLQSRAQECWNETSGPLHTPCNKQQDKELFIKLHIAHSEVKVTGHATSNKFIHSLFYY